MSDDRYNGWTNYATWRVNLEICDDICSSLTGEQTFESVSDLADYLKDEVDEVLTGFGEIPDDGPCSLALDYARAFVEDVNFYEIAEANADELVKSEDEEEDQ